MKKIAGFFLKNPLAMGSFIVLAGSVVGNLGSYLFHLILGRLLGPANYGLLASLISLSYYLAIPLSVLNLLVVKYVSQNNKNKELVSAFVQKISRSATFWGLAGLGFFLLFYPWLKSLLKISSFWLVFGLAINSFFSLYMTIINGVMLGTKEFFKLSFLSAVGSWLRLLLAIVAVLWGMKVGGVIYSTVLATIVVLFWGYEMVKKQLGLNLLPNNKLPKVVFEKLRSYSLAVLVTNIILTSFLTVDVLLARYFFSPAQAGYYASLSVLGKIIFFASSPIVSVMFPLVSERHANGDGYQKPLWASFLAVFLASFLISLVYFLLPKQMINLLFGQKYLSVSSDLVFFAVFASFYSLCSLFLNFFLSVSKTKIVYLGILFAFLQPVLISSFHRSIRQIAEINIAILFLFFLCLMIYYFQCFKVNFRRGKIR
ncbi:MAG: oligosaccharide flippase family protein [Microgenomates group bacterium]